MGRFNDKRILITGGTNGMGLAGARRVIAEGGTVLLTGLNEERLTSAKLEFQENAVIIKNDAAETTATALAQAVASVGPLDGLWLNAAFAALGSPEELVASEFDRMMATNVRGPMLQLAALSPHLSDGASVVVTSSSSIYEGAAATGLYAATKGAVVAMARSWATALAPRGIRVNTLVPGPIETNFRSFLPEEARQGFESFVVNQVPLGRVGTPEEAAAVALFLLSSDSSYVTGSQYAVDGGLIMQ
ncbi:SDR family oxidoreductase [Agrobacterium rubi]|uniref:Putative oxidoreductase n=1 Tax=Agrobacterium rubi TR3 = NBRC 13261 TaxID=1368415 RepID=A0A081D2V6_9HYPH|nr:SDR family oxidoreductase [Agrobacterium rubi]MBP1881515.1 NAD(P)-dependent dehydrogenase (short-subunit alcohol dehydrogenase family) [Agrobacterium rubi]MCL6654521.1 oxidoreductase [Agrobacterium rubi]NTF09305.1 SDR family oxidoreductase [Agrobacterium rubi]NTF22214.1 SDR family oxidoreductase [Agrobacterium rubi]NTF29071.1 SDR family oxidoreductase [Agrobacterium rubi]